MSQVDKDIEEALGLPAAPLDPLEDLLTDALLARKIKATRKSIDPADRHAIDAAAKKMRELYTIPENWERTRGIALIDAATQTLVGNFSEYIHKTVPHTRKLIREHLPISIDAQEVVSGYLGEAMERARGISWEASCQCESSILLDELMVECPKAKIMLRTRLGVIVRAELEEATQFASMNGQTILTLPAGTNVWEACGSDTKAMLRKGVA